MSNSNKTVVTSRRGFLRDAAITSAMVAAGSNLAELALASDTPPVNHVKSLDLGVAPDWSSPGPTLLKLKRLTFLVFRAVKLDSAGNAVDDGTAVIELHGYVSGKFRYRGDEPLAPHPVVLSDLEPCEVFEVETSSWAQRVQGPIAKPPATKSVGRTNPKQPVTTIQKIAAPPGGAPKALRHFIFTFLGVTPGVGVGAADFECLAEKVTADFFTEPFADILDTLEFRDLGA